MEQSRSSGGWKSKEKVYRASFTVEMALVGAVVLVCAGIMIGYGAIINGTWPGRGYYFMAPGVLVLIGFGAELVSRRGRAIRVTPHSIAFLRGGAEIDMPWETITFFLRHPIGKTFMRESVVSDGKVKMRVDSMTYREYDQIISLIQVARRSRRATEVHTV